MHQLPSKLKYMNYRSKLHWNIHVAPVRLAWKNQWGIGTPELSNIAERHSLFNTSSKWIVLVFDFYDIFWYFSH